MFFYHGNITINFLIHEKLDKIKEIINKIIYNNNNLINFYFLQFI